ncbi:MULTISPECIES: fumarylacetoacetate hydrolase family protein [Micrococcales]|jgi:acylpyruvate hydrolase|uniref:fumarylacetoacetate hydrolase family protein n=1 Tax=Micrococcales TaxID=85006 RepID=UPI001EF4F5C3|nr:MULTISPECIES: fumarylacetoacetate hydrolase family protein [Microbacterium]MCG7415553.1 fumarylacetoacetate hydrolase family protein [Microbacterium aurum]MCT1479461.1 fumarylacetoacetate hydrolase family protein [Microbacterium sp. p3-SID336]MCT2225088.1 fumarylacetoacetate hydrolase family protein [Microbacterium paraoxydans]
MRLATLRLDENGTTVAVRVDGDTLTHFDGFPDVGAVLRADALDQVTSAGGQQEALDENRLAPVIVAPQKIICVGLNYRNHIREMGRDLPEFPTLFTKYPESLIGPRDQIQLPPESNAVDWEGELALVVGKTVRRASPEQAAEAIAGYSVLNDVTMRDWQYRTPMWFQGKAWENSTPIGPVFVTPDELPADAVMTTRVDGEIVQQTPINDLVFDSAALISYISTIFTLNPGDVIATGTPGGVGHARKPQRYLTAGQTLSTTVDGIGELVNVAVPEQA